MTQATAPGAPQPNVTSSGSATTVGHSRLARTAHRVFDHPDDVLTSYIDRSENIWFIDGPALIAFFVPRVIDIIASIAVIAAIVMYRTRLVMLFGSIVLVWIGGSLIVKGLQNHYTRYALTSLRIMRSKGVLIRRCDWIPWVKVTDVSYDQSLAGRILGYATIQIYSANENTTLNRFDNLARPFEFHQMIMHLVSRKQGHVAVQVEEVPAAPAPTPHTTRLVQDPVVIEALELEEASINE